MSCFEKQERKFPKMQDKFLILFNKNNKHSIKELKMLKQQLIDSKLINYINLIYINVNNKINLEKYLESKKFNEVKKCYIFDCSQNILNKIFEKNIEVKDFQSLIIGDILTNEKKYYSEEVFKCLIDDFSKFLGGPYLDCYEIDTDNGRILKQKHDVCTILYYDFLFTDLELAKLNANRILSYNYRVYKSDLIRYENVVKETKQKIKEIEEIRNENEKLEMTEWKIIFSSKEWLKMKKLLYYMCLIIFILGICGGIFVILSELNIVTFILAAILVIYAIIIFRKKVK